MTKQHEAMSRAIMLAGGRSDQNQRDKAAKLNTNHLTEKKTAALESERDLLKQMLSNTQKERDDLMKEVHRLHAQGPWIFSYIFSRKKRS